MEEELDDPDPVVDEVALPVVDLAKAPLPEVLALRRGGEPLPREDLGMDANDEHLLVVGTVEDADLAAYGNPLGVTPEVVVVELLVRGGLEARDPNALRVDAAHHVADRPVLAAGVDRLQDDEQAPVVLGGEPGLVVGEEPDTRLEHPVGVRLREEIVLVARVEVPLELDLPPRLDPERLDQLRELPRLVVPRRHAQSPPLRRPKLETSTATTVTR